MKRIKYSMTDGNILPSIVAFSLPLLGSSLIQQLYNTADLIFVGNYTGKTGAAAVGASGLVFTCLIGLFTGISVGINILVSQFVGGKKYQEASKTAHTALLFGMLGSIVLTILGIAFARPVLLVLRTPQEVLAEAVSYVRIYFLSMAAMVLYNMGSSILRAAGNSKVPFYILIAGGLTNVLFDFLLVAVWKMGVEGAAIATSISQTISAVGVLGYLMGEKSEIRISVSKLRVDGPLLKRILYVGLPAGVQSIVITLSNIIVQWYINGYGAEAVAAFAAYFKVENFIYMPIMAFGQAITTFAGQNLGADKIVRIKKGTMATILLSGGISILTAAALLAGKETIFRLFVDDGQVAAFGTQIVTVTFPFYWLYSILEITGGAVRGMGKSLTAMAVTLLTLCGGRILLLRIMTSFVDGIQGIAPVYPLTWVTAAIAFTMIFYYIMKPFGIRQKADHALYEA